jgi:hypothetical protein
MRTQDSLVLYKSFNILWIPLTSITSRTCLLGAKHLPVLEPGELAHGPVDDGGPAAQHALPPLVPREAPRPRSVPEAGLYGYFTA